MLAPTEIYDRAARCTVTEQVFGGTALALTYQNPVGRRIGAWPRLQRAISRIVGWYQSTSRSASGIEPFVRQYGIRLEDYQVPAGGFRSFNDFFVRKLAPGARSFPAEADVLGAAAEGRLSVFPISSPQVAITIKGVPVSIAALVGVEPERFTSVGGYVLVFRLCPVDYHRFHFPDAGVPGAVLRIPGLLHSVHPAAQRVVPDLFLQNERQVVCHESERFGRLTLVDVGAMCVGKIVQTYPPGHRVERGAERGYFEFGGSTTIVVTEPGRVVPDPELLARTAAGLEVLVRLGEPVGRAGPGGRS